MTFGKECYPKIILVIAQNISQIYIDICFINSSHCTDILDIFLSSPNGNLPYFWLTSEILITTITTGSAPTMISTLTIVIYLIFFK